MITVQVCYFAVLRDRSGLSMESLDTECKTVRELVDDLVERRRLGLPSPLIRAAINGSFVEDSSTLDDGDEIDLIPPVSGG